MTERPTAFISLEDTNSFTFYFWRPWWPRNQHSLESEMKRFSWSHARQDVICSRKKNTPSYILLQLSSKCPRRAWETTYRHRRYRCCYWLPESIWVKPHVRELSDAPLKTWNWLRRRAFSCILRNPVLLNPFKTTNLFMTYSPKSSLIKPAGGIHLCRFYTNLSCCITDPCHLNSGTRVSGVTCQEAPKYIIGTLYG